MPLPARIFVSHASNDSEWCRAFVAGLRMTVPRVDVWFHEDLPLTRSGRTVTESALRDMPVFVAVLSPAALASDWVQHETSLALELAAHDSNRRIISVIARACEIPTRLMSHSQSAGTADSNLSPGEAALRVAGLLARPQTGGRTPADRPSLAASPVQHAPSAHTHASSAAATPSGDEAAEVDGEHTASSAQDSVPDSETMTNAAPLVPLRAFTRLDVARRATLALRARPLLMRLDDPVARRLAQLELQATTPEHLTQMYELGVIPDPGAPVKPVAPPSSVTGALPGNMSIKVPPRHRSHMSHERGDGGRRSGKDGGGRRSGKSKGKGKDIGGYARSGIIEKLGGEAVRIKYGPEFYSRISKKGGKLPERMSDIFGRRPAKTPAQERQGEGNGEGKDERQRDAKAPPRPTEPDPQPAVERETREEVNFSSYFPRTVAPKTWETLLVYIALDSEQAQKQVESAAAARLGSSRAAFRSSGAPGEAPLARGVPLTIVPWLSGFTFNPAFLPITWNEDVQLHEFRLRADDVATGQTVRGCIQFFEGPVLRGEVALSIGVQRPEARAPHPTTEPASLAHSSARGYRSVFPSYSRSDETLVERYERVVQTNGDRYMRDVNALRSGECWAPRLLELIEQADIFQLFWSPAADRSAQVEREWRHALTLAAARPTFIRPMFWTQRAHRPIPPELKPFNFSRLDPAALGLEIPSP